MPADSLFDQALRAEGVSGKLADLARSIYSQESTSGKNSRTSNAGAMGGMQILPSTFASVADKGWDITDPLQNARGGIRYLKHLDTLSGGDPALTAAGYYGGPGALAKAKQGIAVSDPRNPTAPNTLQYGKQVVARMAGAANDSTSTPPPVAPAVAVAAQEAPPMTVAVAQPATPPLMMGAPVPGNGADAWQEFLRTMPQGQRAPQVAVNDLSFGPVASVAPAAMQPVQVASARPNFDAFTSWKGRAA